MGVPVTDRVEFTAACPSCGGEAQWVAMAVHSSPWPHHGLPTLVTTHEIECGHCDTPQTATTMAA